MLLRLFILIVTVLALVGGVRAGTSTGDERPAHALAGGDAAGAPDLDPDADTGGEVVLPASGEAPAVVPVCQTGRPTAPLSVGRLHAARLFRPPEIATTGSFTRS